jgi:hypothetical protein
LRERYGFSEYAFHQLAKALRVSWLAEHLDAVLAQTLATRAYRALNRVCLGKAKRVRFKSRRLDSLENKRNDTGMRFVIEAHGLGHPIKYARLVRRRTCSRRAQGANRQGERYCVQLVLTGLPHHKPKHTAGTDTIGLDLGPASIAIVPREAEAHLEPLCAELRPDARAIRRLQRKMERQRRAANPEHYDERGRPKKRAKGAPRWKESRSYQATRRRKATRERKLAAHRKSLHGRLVHQIVRVGNTIITEKISYKGWQKRYGRSVGRCAPGMLIDHLRRTVVSTGGTLYEVPTRTTKLSQYCHGCRTYVPKPLSQRLHQCPCGIGPVQRDLYSAFLAAFLDPADPIPSCARYVIPWAGAGVGGEARLVAAHERAKQRANEGQVMRRPHGYPPCRSASAQKSERSHTRAAFPLQERESRSVEAPLRTPVTTPGGSSGIAAPPWGRRKCDRHC